MITYKYYNIIRPKLKLYIVLGFYYYQVLNKNIKTKYFT